MHIGIDVRPALTSLTGIGTYVRELVLALAQAFPDDRYEGYGHGLRGRSRRLERPVWPANARLHDRPWPATGTRVLAGLGWGAQRMLGGVDLLHETDYVPLFAERVLRVATVHDVLFETLPECYTSVMRTNLRRATRRAVEVARRVIVPSQRVKDELVARFRAEPERVDVVPHGTPSHPPGPPTRVRGRYVLAVGTLEPRKNLPRLLAALDLVRARGEDVYAIVVGGPGWLDGPTRAALSERPWVVQAGAADEATTAALRANACVLAYPSLGEGFGLPVLEGFAAGVPVLVGSDTACSDLAGDAALAVDARSVEALAEGLTSLVGDSALRARLVARGRVVAAQHTWERTARLTRAVYAKALEA